MIFPLKKFWEYSPLGFVAACLWNLSETTKIPLPYAGKILGLIIGRKAFRK